MIISKCIKSPRSQDREYSYYQTQPVSLSWFILSFLTLDVTTCLTFVMAVFFSLPPSYAAL